ncbi:DUF2690 domain-containing protein [Umezawaea beigongshangensis]|uniref:DUF2690 domain-containing protein n=1 Tax=Umezawaea beigongshangensis TaxID=2780383 RepID=UPI0018F1B05B|nr:DUF2690 domain-containing protein [Umezawaea beigongshangensis]
MAKRTTSRSVVAGVVLAATAGLLAAAPASAAPVPPRAPRSCDGGEPIAGDAITARSATYGSIVAELRYSPSYACAWGRVRGGRLGDGVHVSRRWNSDPAQTEYNIASAMITSGSTVYTPWFDDDGHTMSACAVNEATQTVYTCTGWY